MASIAESAQKAIAKASTRIETGDGAAAAAAKKDGKCAQCGAALVTVKIAGNPTLSPPQPKDGYTFVGCPQHDRTAWQSLLLTSPESAEKASAIAAYNAAADSATKKEPKFAFAPGHYHYLGCKNDTEATKDATDCDCASRASVHAQKLVEMGYESQPADAKRGGLTMGEDDF
jgi:hypothetical protein